MKIFPAIDIRNGKCVRLVKGCFEQETIYADNPVDMAMRWQNEGAEYLHVVDLDGALAGKTVNLDIVAEIANAVKIPLQLGGGIRNLNTIEKILTLGVDRVILGSIAVKEPELVKEACREFGKQIAVGIDAKNGQVAVEGWGISGNILADELGKRMADVGVGRIIYTDISRDGTLEGVNVEATANLAQAVGVPVIASGGVGSMADIDAIKQMSSVIEGVIVGKALYTGSVTLPEILRRVRGEE